MTLARHVNAEPFRTLLEESARQYRCAVDEIGTAWKSDRRDEVAIDPARYGPEADDGDDLFACWERSECETLTYFRDAYDGELTEPLAGAVKRHYEAGITRLESLQRLKARRRYA